MSGYGACEASGPGGCVRVEVRTLNHRYLDLVVQLPKAWSALEEPIRDAVRARLVRGRVEVRVTAQDSGLAQRRVRVQSSVLAQYWRQLAQIAGELGVAGPPSLAALLSLPEVVVVEEAGVDDPQWVEAILGALAGALDQVEAMRRAEGARLWADIEGRLDRIRERLRRLTPRVEEVTQEAAGRLRERAEQLLQAAGCSFADRQSLASDEGWQRRLAQEVALLAQRSDISEELTRLDSHAVQMARLAQERAPGRRMEFLVREMDREAATAASKVVSSEMVHELVEVRAEIERIREQVANLE